MQAKSCLCAHKYVRGQIEELWEFMDGDRDICISAGLGKENISFKYVTLLLCNCSGAETDQYEIPFCIWTSLYKMSSFVMFKMGFIPMTKLMQSLHMFKQIVQLQ